MGELICAGWLLDGTGEQHKDWGILFQGQQVRDVGPATELLQIWMPMTMDGLCPHFGSG